MDIETNQGSIMFTQQLDNLLATLSQLTAQEELHTPSQDTLAVISKQSSRWLKLANDFPIQFCALPQLFNTQYSYSVNLISHHIVWATLLCKRLRWADLSTQYMIRIAMSFFWANLKTVNQHYLHRKPVDNAQLNRPSLSWIKVLSKIKQPIWEDGLSIGNLHGQSAQKQLGRLGSMSQIQQISWLSAYLSLNTTPNKMYTLSPFAHVVRQLSQRVDDRMYELLDELVANPGLVPPGSFVVTHNNEFAWVLSQNQTDFVVQYSYKDGEFDESAPKILASDNIKQIATPRRIKNTLFFDKLWSKTWVETAHKEEQAISIRRSRYKLDHPPALLKNLHQELESREPDLIRICNLINRDANYAQHLQTTATHNSRQRLPFHEVKHALIYNGYYRTGCILTQQALITRLTQDYFPLQSTCLSIIELASKLANELGKGTQQWLAEEFSCFVTLMCCGYFINPAFKVLNRPKHLSLKKFRTLLDLTKNAELISKAVVLAKAWEQDTTFIKALSLIGKSDSLNIKRKPDFLAVILELSLNLALHIYIERSLPTIIDVAPLGDQLQLDNQRLNAVILTCLQDVSFHI